MLLATKLSHRVSKFYVTDFTLNAGIGSQFTEGIHLGNETVAATLVLQVELFAEKLATFMAHFLEIRGHAFHDSGDKTEVALECIFLAMEVKVKAYMGVVEANVASIEIIQPPRCAALDRNGGLTRLWSSFFASVPQGFIEDHYQQLVLSIPSNYWPQDALRVHPKMSDTTIPVKEEPLSHIPEIPRDMNHSQDFQNSSEEEVPLTATPIPAYEPPQSPSQASNNTTFVSNITLDENFFPVRYLNEHIDSFLLTLYYPVKVRLLGVYPGSVELFCPKQYEYDESTQRYEVHDPKVRSLELVVTDVEDENHEGRKDNLRLSLDEEDVLAFFGFRSVEEMYVSPGLVQEKLITLSRPQAPPFEVNIYLKEVVVGNRSLVRWALKRVNINDLILQRG
ncbi:hypothetical protein BABINDRAFT_5373 [Babjeviella inositovora NRRL Y-12698]|uniref:Uncharacterized protein n=1 Tax=Babjeviella inositovora NRRL Y-12698 TaxID=984486 RepID=A0A1E3QXL6_9ASCO|nr:uncharacterized protein BABINDRAFT_5373 [Babjeviella inositovora NRRL Y-12698]ODQ82396.1 hypothetical protein BABINDRAFT_5373 [Babjeviella inositovora NRRL Y-12698]